MADEKIIFSMVGVSKTFTNQKKVLNNIYLSFFYGAKIGIIGLNGSGKSTLMKIIAGLDKNFQGEVVFSPGYTVGYLEQEPRLDDSKTVREVVEEGCAATVALLKEYEEINMKLCEPMDDEQMARLIERQGELYEQIDQVNGWELDSVLERAMDALRCPDPDQSVKVLSGGERRRVALCRLLLQQPDVLLLDEPTNHLDAESIDWLEQHLQQYKGTVIAVTHDRYFLDNVAGWILELDRGEGIPWKGNYSGWLDQKTTRMAMEEKQESKRRKTLERELEWVRMSPSGRHAKSKARLSAYDKMMNEDTKQKEEKLEIFIPNGPRLGDVVIEAHDVSKAYGDRVLYEHLEFSLPPAGIVGVIGPNGVGKTTSIGKIAASLKKQGKRVMLCAADTFRAAAADQLEIWAERAGCEIVRQYEGADPGAVLFDALQAAKARNVDVVLCDTAGRLHNKANLMAELAKLSKIIDRECPGCDRETLLVLDATTGQNGLIQARTFKETAGLTGIVLTKLDGTAKGGIVIAIARELGVPVKFAGVGEGIDDLKPFDARSYVEAII